MQIIPTGQTLGARIEGLDLARNPSEQEVEAVLQALGEYGVLEFQAQHIDSRQLRDFSGRFGELFVSPGGRAQVPGLPEVMILSNVVGDDGKPLGLTDAGQSWHTDMSYMRMIALSNILYAHQVPYREGVPLGATQFRNMHAAYEGLPAEVKTLLDGRTGRHDFEKFWEAMRQEKGVRAPLSDEERKKRPPVSQPLFLTHPITGRKVLYANPGYLTSINGLPPSQSAEMVEMLIQHQLRPEYLYEFRWSPRSVLMWDNIGTIHNAVADYGPDEPRYIERCQVMATRYFGEDGTLDPLARHAVSA